MHALMGWGDATSPSGAICSHVGCTPWAIYSHSLCTPPPPALSTEIGHQVYGVPLDSAPSIGPAQAGPHPLGPSLGVKNSATPLLREHRNDMLRTLKGTLAYPQTLMRRHAGS
jgi:hypothetical protein